MATLFNHKWPRFCGGDIYSHRKPLFSSFRARVHWPLCSTTCGRVFVARIFIPVGNHYFPALASTLQFVAQVCDRLWLVPATDRAFAYITYMSPPHVALVWPPQKRGHMWLNKVARKRCPIPSVLRSEGKFTEGLNKESLLIK